MAVLKIFEPSVDFVDKCENLHVGYSPLEKHNPDFSSTQVIVAALNEEEGIGLTIAELMDNLNSPKS